MPQRLLLEGSDIDELLARVQAEHGPHARIVHAEQRLVGGFAGFFARRRYELSIQVDDEAAGPAARVLDAVVTPAAVDVRASTDVRSGPDARPAANAREVMGVRDVGPSSIADLLEQADRADAAVVGPSPVQLGGRPERLTGSVGSGTPRGSRGVTGTVTTGRRLSTQSPEFELLLSDLVARADRARGLDQDGSTGRVEGVVAESVNDAPVDHARRLLARLGLPDHLVPARLAADPRTALLDVLGAVPTPTDDRLWGTTVVVGTTELAARTVELLLPRSGCVASDVLVATSETAGSAELAVQASALCSAGGAAVVVIETPATRAAARRAGRLAAGFGLGSVVVALDAVRDGAAQREWLAALADGGRAATSAALFDVAESPTPLALLGLGPEIGWVDGRPAGVGAWAAPCLDRLLSLR